MTTRLKDCLNDATPAFGITLTIPDPFVAEVMAGQSFDYLMIDTEHSPIGAGQLQTQLIALRTAPGSLLVRVAHNDATVIGQVLDLGADGVVVPHIENATECAAAVCAALYPPAGERGIGPRRAARLTDRNSYLRNANHDLYVGIMIESGPGVDNLDEILAVEGVGGVTIGEEDLAASLGHLGDPKHPAVAAAVEEIADRCLAHGVPFGMYAATRARAHELVLRGARMISVGSDILFLEQGMRAIVDSISTVRDERPTASIGATR